MQRLAQENTNSAEEYDQVYLTRQQKGVDSQDLRRWKRLLKHYKGGKLLDIGALDSKIVDLIADTKNYTGIDIAKKAMEGMRQKGIGKFLVMDLYKMDFENESFDYVIMGEVLEHLEKPEEAIKEAMRVLKPKGVLAVSVPLDEAKEIGAVDHEHHLWSYSIQDIKELLLPYGKVKVATLGSELFPIYRYHFPTLLAWGFKK